MEDLGKTSLADIYNKNLESDIFSSYKKALDLLLKTQKNILVKPDFIPSYSNGYLSFEENLMTDWYIPALTGKRLSEKSITSFKKIWQKLNKKIQAMPKSLVLLDYHADNLMIKTDKMVALDFQDARWGGFLYDVISLLEDERHPLPEAVSEKLWDYYSDELVDTSEVPEEERNTYDYRSYEFEDEYLEWYEKHFTTPSGDKMVAFGNYGRDG
jgi:aminoglycoside/choline kinase family phosphotransferase